MPVYEYSNGLPPARNARAWQRARDQAIAEGRAGDFPYMLQLYTMLNMLPPGVYKGRLAAASLAPFFARSDSDGARPLIPLGVHGALKRAAEGKTTLPVPNPLPEDVRDAMRDLPVHPEQHGDVLDMLEQAKQTAASRVDLQAMTQDVAHAAGLVPGAIKVLQHRMDFLYAPALYGASTSGEQPEEAVKSMKPKLRVARKAKYVSKRRVGDRWQYVYADAAPATASTQSGKRVYHADSSAYTEVHAKPMGKQHEAVRDHFPRYTAQDHRDAAAVHSQRGSGRFGHLIAAAHQEAADKLANKARKGKGAIMARKTIKKSNPLNEVSLPFTFEPSKQNVFGMAVIDDKTGQPLTADTGSFDELAQMLAGYASVNAYSGEAGTLEVIDTALNGESQPAGAVTAKRPTSEGTQPLSPLPPQNPWIDYSGNAPTEPPMQEVYGLSEGVSKSIVDALHLGPMPRDADARFVHIPAMAYNQSEAAKLN